MNLFSWTYYYAFHHRRQQLMEILIFQAIFCVWTGSSGHQVGISRAIQIYDVAIPNKNIDRAAINSVLDQVGDRPIRVISIIGPSRSGKSFLLSYFIRHFESQNEDVDVEERLSGFECRGGQEGVTAGINLWSKPYFVKSENGDEIAILLLDTQGLFDKKTTYRQNAIIFTISSLLSSVFMYNQKDVVLENTLQHINCFSNLADNIAKKVNAGKSAGALGLPRNLMILLRDLDMAEYDYGLHTSEAKPKGSPNNYILDLLLLKSGGDSASHQIPANPEESRRVRKQLQNLYSDISAFVMPHPGSAFLKDTGNRSPSREFRKQATNLVTSVISMETATISKAEFKKVLDNIEKICKNSATYFLEAQSMEEMQSINEHGNSLNKARLLYEGHLNVFLSQYPNGAPHLKLLTTSKNGIKLVEKEFENLEKYSAELEERFIEERQSAFEDVLHSAILTNARNRVPAEAKRREIKRQRDVYKSNLETLGRYLTYGGGAVAAVGAVLPGPGTVAAVAGGLTAALGAVIRDLGDAEVNEHEQ